LHQVPILLCGGRRFFQQLSEHVEFRLVEAVPAAGVTHLRYEVLDDVMTAAERRRVIRRPESLSTPTNDAAHFALAFTDPGELGHFVVVSFPA
jgi:hypothetical protein